MEEEEERNFFGTYLTPSANREFSELALHIGARRIVTFVIAEGIVFVVDHLAVDVVVTRDAQLSKVLIDLEEKGPHR